MMENDESEDCSDWDDAKRRTAQLQRTALAENRGGPSSMVLGILTCAAGERRALRFFSPQKKLQYAKALRRTTSVDIRSFQPGAVDAFL